MEPTEAQLRTKLYEMDMEDIGRNISEYAPLDIKSILHTYPNRIAVRETEEMKEQKEIDSMKDKQGKIYKAFDYNVLEDSNKDQWKEKLSNAKKREQELNIRLKECKDYQELQNEIPKKSQRLDDFKRTTKRLLREWQSAKALARMHGG